MYNPQFIYQANALSAGIYSSTDHWSFCHFVFGLSQLLVLLYLFTCFIFFLLALHFSRIHHVLYKVPTLGRLVTAAICQSEIAASLIKNVASAF